MNDSSGNGTDLDNTDACLIQGAVVSMMIFFANGLCFVLGLPALVWCLWLSLSGSLSGGLKPTKVFPINLFAVELVFCVSSLLLMVSSFIENDMFQQAHTFIFGLSWTCRPLLQSCICVERYLAVVHPVAFLKYRRRRYRVASSTLFWVLSLTLSCSFTLMDYEAIEHYVLISVYCLGVVIISLCSFFILRVLKQPGPGEVEGGRVGEKKQRTTDPQKMKAFGIVLTNLVMILTSSISVVVGVTTMSSSLDITCNVTFMLLIVNIFSVMISPLMHLYREGRLLCQRVPETR
jgi:hypothetical protein